MTPLEHADAQGARVDLDVEALSAHLGRDIPGFDAIRRVERFVGGQSNPTYRVDTDAGPYVLRRKPSGTLLASAHLVEREYRVLASLSTASFPVPKPIVLVEDPSVLGTTFYVMEHVEGRIFRSPALPDLDPRGRREVYLAAIDTLVALHELTPAALGLDDFGKHGGYARRQLERWSKQYVASKRAEMPEMDELAAWLARELDAAADLGAAQPEPVTLVHGDYRLDNLVIDAAAPRVRAVLDWELATLGHPLADLAYVCIPYHLPSGREKLPGLMGLDLDALGIPTEHELVSRYFERRTSAPTGDVRFYLALALFRLAAILVGVHARAVGGNAAAPDALAVGQLAHVLAERGLGLTRS